MNNFSDSIFSEMIIKAIDQLNSFIGRAISWLTFVLVLLICVDVALRYLFDFSTSGLFEMEWHLFAAIFMLGAAYTLRKDKHVRVDVFYARFSRKQQAWVNIIGTIFFLLPFCYVVFITSIPFVTDAYAMNESSPDPGGLPYRFIIKSVIPIGFLLLFLQGIAELLKEVKALSNPTDHA